MAVEQTHPLPSDIKKGDGSGYARLAYDLMCAYLNVMTKHVAVVPDTAPFYGVLCALFVSLAISICVALKES